LSDLPDDDSDSLILGYLLNEDDIVPIDFVCVKCNHSFEKHSEGICNTGVFRKCECKHFVLNQNQLKQAKYELQTIEDILLQNYEQAKKLESRH